MSFLGAESRREWGRIPVGNAPGDCAVDPVTGRLFVSSAGSRSLVAIEDEHTGPSPLEPVPHPLLGRRLPSFALPEVRTGRMIQSLRWAERKYIVNFFASW